MNALTRILANLFPWLLGLAAGWVRMAGIADKSLTQDESTMTLFAMGVLERGYPFIMRGDTPFLISTYELVPYPIALSTWLFGVSELGTRLPAVLFGVLTTICLFFIGRRWFDWRAGALAASIYAFLPWSIYWGSNGFYPSQLAFFSLLTIAAVRELLIRDEVEARWYYLVFASFEG